MVFLNLISVVDVRNIMQAVWTYQDWDFWLVFTMASNSNQRLRVRTGQEMDETRKKGGLIRSTVNPDQLQKIPQWYRLKHTFDFIKIVANYLSVDCQQCLISALILWHPNDFILIEESVHPNSKHILSLAASRIRSDVLVIGAEGLRYTCLKAGPLPKYNDRAEWI